MGKSETVMVARFCAGLAFEELPQEVVDRAKYFFLDYLGVAARGSRTDSSGPVQRFVAAQGEGLATVIGRHGGAPAPWAALANGTAAHSLELDDTHREGSVHLGVSVFSAALALAEELQSDGRRFLAAAVAGYEVAARLAMALGPAEHYGRGFHPTGTCGAFGAAAAAGRLLGLEADRMASALGIAGSQAAGSMEFLAEGAWTKRLHPGWAAHAGLVAARLAALDFRGPASILEGRDGFLRSHSAAPRPERCTEGLGGRWEILRTGVKPHACCRYKQAPIDAILKIVRDHDVRAADVEAVTVAVLDVAFPIICEPPERKYDPRSVVDAQFSMPYGAAVAIARRRAGLPEYSPETLADPEVRKLLRRVHLVRDPELSARFPAEWPARVTIELRDGRKLGAEVRYPKGDPENPLTWEELEAKFRDLAGAVLSGGTVDTVLAKVRHLESTKSIAEVTQALANGAGS